MKTIKHLLILGSLVVLVISCRKSEQSATNSINVGNLAGSYQWEYSINQINNTSANLPDHYGVVITTKGQFDYYKNNQLLFSDDVTNLVSSNDTITFSLKNKTGVTGKFYGTTLKMISSYNQTPVPYANYYSYQYFMNNVVSVTLMVVSNNYTKL